jgi:ribose/xylose/arabinose/galactoside ABC-type transport system permease subunit
MTASPDNQPESIPVSGENKPVENAAETRPETPSGHRRLPQWLGPLLGLVAVYALFCLLCTLQGTHAFRTFYNTKTILTQTVIIGIGALGMTLIIVSGAIDLSVGSVIALVTVVVALVLRREGAGIGPWAIVWIGTVPPVAAGAWWMVRRKPSRRALLVRTLSLPTAIFAALLLVLIAVCRFAPAALLPVGAIALGVAAAVGCGWVSGIVVTRMRIVSFIATLGMMQVARGLAKWLARNQTVVPPGTTWINNLMMVDPTPRWLLFSPGIWLMILLLILLHVLLTRTVFGRYVYAVGSNEPTARLCGIDVENTRILIFALAAAFIGISGVMQFANLTVGDPTAAVGMELDIIAAVVIGGGSLNGGEGSAVGTLVGALIMAVLRNGCNMLGVPNYTQNIIVGSVIIGAAGIDSIKHRMRGA